MINFGRLFLYCGKNGEKEKEKKKKKMENKEKKEMIKKNGK